MKMSLASHKLHSDLRLAIGKPKESSYDIRDRIVALHKSGSSLDSISRQLVVPGASVQTIVHKYKYFRRTALKPRS